MAFHDAKDPLWPDRESVCRRLSLRELPRIGPLTSPSSIGASSPSSQRIDARFLSTETAGTALSVKKSDREDDPRCLPSIGARAFERGCDAAPFFGGDLAPNLAARRYRCASFDPHLRSRRGDVTSVARSSVACRGERRAYTFRCVSGLSPSAEPPPTPNRSPSSRTAPDPMLLWATTALPISAVTSMHGHAHELSTLFSARPSPLSALMKSRAVCRSPPRAPRGERRPLSEPWALACGRRREKRGARVLRREQHG